MLQISPETAEDLKQIMKEQNINSTSLRIIARIGWGGMSYDLVLDEPGELDTVEEHEGLTFMAENRVVERYGPFKMTSFKRGNRVYMDINSIHDTGGGGCDSCTSCG